MIRYQSRDIRPTIRSTQARRVQSNPRSCAEPRAIPSESGVFLEFFPSPCLMRASWARITRERMDSLAIKETPMQRDALASVLPHSGLPIGNAGCHDSILRTIGWTPLVKLRRLTEGLQAQVLVKVESSNPGGSVKDRVALAMIAEAEYQGWLKPGGTIIEATAGNTGVGLAMVAAVKGYRCIFVLPDKMSAEKISLLKGYGAEVVITPTNVPPDSPESYNGVADRLAREIPGAWRPNQFTNLANPEMHYRSTGPEIWKQTEGRVTAFVAGVGTGGTISGVARYLKEQNPEIKIIGADPEGSVLSGGTPKSWKVEGIG